MFRFFRSHFARKPQQRTSAQRRLLRHEPLEWRRNMNADVGDLSLLSDEFNSSSTQADWQLVTESEGWDARPFELFDVNQTTPGAMTIAPHSSTWYQDYQGDLAFKEVTGDFIVSSRLSLTDRDDRGGSDPDDIPADSWFSLAGIMVRTPTGIVDAESEWEAGNANFVFAALGHSWDGTTSFESKTTTESVSQLEMRTLGATEIELRVIREGSTITTQYRLTATSDWEIGAVYDRPDMPATLQVGLMAATDFAKVATFTPLYANSHTLEDSPENTANSSEPWREYNPDIQARFDYIRFERPAVETITVVAEVEVVNPGFEDLTGESPYNEFSFGPLLGWDLYDPQGIASNGVGPTFFIGTLEPGEIASQPGVIQNFPGGAPEGRRVAIAFNFAGSGDLGEYGYTQTLASTLAANTVYSLSVDIGNIATGTDRDGQTFFLDGMPGYRIELVAGGQVVAADNNSLAGSIPEGEFRTSVITFDSGPSPAQLGLPLEIRLINLNQASGVPAGNDLEVDFDNVRLTATTVTIIAGNSPESSDEFPQLGVASTGGSSVPDVSEVDCGLGDAESAMGGDAADSATAVLGDAACLEEVDGSDWQVECECAASDSASDWSTAIDDVFGNEDWTV